MTLKRPLAEKVSATAAAYRGLVEELGVPRLGVPAEVEAALIHAATQIAMGTQTQDLGLLAQPTTPEPEDD